MIIVNSRPKERKEWLGYRVDDAVAPAFTCTSIPDQFPPVPMVVNGQPDVELIQRLGFSCVVSVIEPHPLDTYGLIKELEDTLFFAKCSMRNGKPIHPQLKHMKVIIYLLESLTP